LFHLPNIFMGIGLIGIFQIILAAFSGCILYVFRRKFGVLWPAMVAHGAWDSSTFLAGGFGSPWLALTSVLMQLVSSHWVLPCSPVSSATTARRSPSPWLRGIASTCYGWPNSHVEGPFPKG
jgi:hypothetical protein